MATAGPPEQGDQPPAPRHHHRIAHLAGLSRRSRAGTAAPRRPALPPVTLTLALAATALAALATLASLPLPTTPSAGATGATTPAWVAPPDDHWGGNATANPANPANPAGCDPIDPAQCMLPYPNDFFTRPDPTSATERRLNLNVFAMPRNVLGEPVIPTAWNASDGFSAGSQILTVVPGLTKNTDLTPSHLPPVTDLSENADPNIGVILLDTETGQHVPVWAEVDQNTHESGVVSTGAVQQDLIIHPAVNLSDGTRYIVALRNLVTDNGTAPTPSAAFSTYRNGTAPATDPRRAHMEGIFETLTEAGWTNRSSIYLAWDFTTASTQNVTGRLVSIRDQAFAQLGETPAQLAEGKVVGRSPQFFVNDVTDFTPQQNANVARQITGYFTVPCFIGPTCDPPVKCAQLTGGLFDDCPSPGTFVLNPLKPDSVPHQVAGQTYEANFICNVGRSAYESGQKLRPVEYGHGLFGSATEVNASAQEEMAGGFGMMYCATDWFGMASADVPNALLALSNISLFPMIADRVQQGELNFLYLARLMVHPDGFSSNAAFQWSDGTSFIDTTQAYYDGNSQGGIYGGTVCAVSVDVRHCVLGVPGMNYSVLLPRSADYVDPAPLLSDLNPKTFDLSNPTNSLGYSQVFDTFYPDQAQRELVLDLIQTLWDRADPDGYASDITGGLPDTPSHQVLLQMAWGDHQVPNVEAETEARTIGAALVGGPLPTSAHPALVPPRFGPYQDPFWGIPSIASYPYRGSALAVFDTGPFNAANPKGTGLSPTSDLPNYSGNDPHEAPRIAPLAQQEKSAFMEPAGQVSAPGSGPPYFAFGWNGATGL
jgi:hypothetical protein